MTIRPTDLLILTARNEDDVSHIEVSHTPLQLSLFTIFAAVAHCVHLSWIILEKVWVCEEGDSGEQTGTDVNTYVHHDILLPAFPLCMAWMDCNVRPGAAPTDRGLLASTIHLSPSTILISRACHQQTWWLLEPWNQGLRFGTSMWSATHCCLTCYPPVAPPLPCLNPFTFTFWPLPVGRSRTSFLSGWAASCAKEEQAERQFQGFTCAPP